MSRVTEPEALAALLAAESAHAEIVAAKYETLGRRVGDWVPELNSDPEIVAAYKRVQIAERAYVASLRRSSR